MINTEITNTVGKVTAFNLVFTFSRFFNSCMATVFNYGCHSRGFYFSK